MHSHREAAAFAIIVTATRRCFSGAALACFAILFDHVFIERVFILTHPAHALFLSQFVLYAVLFTALSACAAASALLELFQAIGQL